MDILVVGIVLLIFLVALIGLREQALRKKMMNWGYTLEDLEGKTDSLPDWPDTSWSEIRAQPRQPEKG